MAEPSALTGRRGRPRAARRLGVACAVLVALAGLAPSGCASLPPPRAVTDLGLIVGRWRGQIAFSGRPYELFYLTINPDGTLIGSWGPTTRWGRVTLEGGRVRFGLYIWSGNLEYLEGGGDRVLLLKEDFATWDAIVRPLT